MIKRLCLACAAASAFWLAAFCLPVLAEEARPAEGKQFEQYRTAIMNAHGMDVRDFRERLQGGRADGKAITRYDLQQLLMGITVEQEHTSDKFTALEISTDHLEEFPNYYTRLAIMEEEAERERAGKAVRTGK